jgi:DNA primase
MEIHQRYLLDRQFDPFKIEQEWGIKGTNHIDPYYKFRIIAPIWFNNQIVSYQARDITGQQNPPYRACRPEDEVMSHKDVLYGNDFARGTSIVVVEGITDAWRLGAGAVATFGVKWTVAQAMKIVQHPYWNKVFILYDPDDAGQAGGVALFHFLRGFMDNVELLEMSGFSDPGSMPDSEARYLMRKELKI